jgi:hypothetical protein
MNLILKSLLVATALLSTGCLTCILVNEEMDSQSGKPEPGDVGPTAATPEQQPFDEKAPCAQFDPGKRRLVETVVRISETDKRNKAGNRALDPASRPEFGHLPPHAAPRFFAASRNSYSFSERRVGVRRASWW